MNIQKIETSSFFTQQVTPIKSVPSFKSANTYERTPQNDTFELSIGYVNDLHGQTNNMMRILSGIKGDIVLSGGDNDIGDEKNRAVHDATARFLNLANVRATALGNHEMDTMQGDLAETANKFNGHILSVNIEQKPIETQNSDDVKKYNRVNLRDSIKKSVITNVKGEKIGIIGTTPVDLQERCTHPGYHKDCSFSTVDKTIEDVQKEVDEFKKQGINKIILVSHLGHKVDKKLANSTDGIDIIVSGHTHELFKGIEEGENLLFSKTGEPIIITEAGRDGKYFGELKVTFDNNGVITKAQNNLGDTSMFHKNLVHQYMFNEILGKPEVVGTIEKILLPPKSLIEENPHANFMCDAMKYEMNADIAIWNNGGPRNYFHEGVIDSSDINEISPFKDNISVAEVSEKTIVKAFKDAIEISYRTEGHKPGFLSVSGLNYTVSPSKKTVVAMNYIDKNGQEHPIDVDNPREDKKYKVVADSFLMSWGADYDIFAPKEECTEYSFTKAYLACEYIKHLNRPIVINQTGRIRFSD